MVTLLFRARSLITLHADWKIDRELSLAALRPVFRSEKFAEKLYADGFPAAVHVRGNAQNVLFPSLQR
jgi:hypothetical protein